MLNKRRIWCLNLYDTCSHIIVGQPIPKTFKCGTEFLKMQWPDNDVGRVLDRFSKFNMCWVSGSGSGQDLIKHSLIIEVHLEESDISKVNLSLYNDLLCSIWERNLCGSLAQPMSNQWEWVGHKVFGRKANLFDWISNWCELGPQNQGQKSSEKECLSWAVIVVYIVGGL